VWKYTLIIPALGRSHPMGAVRRRILSLRPSPVYIVRTCLKKKEEKKINEEIVVHLCVPSSTIKRQKQPKYPSTYE
jgi:hypothetical protein